MSCTSEHAQLTRCFVGIVVFRRSAFGQNMVFILNHAVLDPPISLQINFNAKYGIYSNGRACNAYF